MDAAYAISALSLAVSVIALWKGFHDSSVTERENDFRARRQYNAEVRSWAAECTNALSGAVYLAALGSADPLAASAIISILSALLEQGRLFFPNNPLTAGGRSELPAHEGRRPRILDWLVYALRTCATLAPGGDPAAERILKKLQAGFTSDVQFVLDPRNPLSRMSDLTKLLQDGEFMDSSQVHPDVAAAREFVADRKNPSAASVR